MLGKFVGPGDPASYITKAGTDHTYFSLGNKWNAIRTAQGLTDDDLFNSYNVRFMQEGIDASGTFDSSHNPVGDMGFLGKGLRYLEAHNYVYDPSTMQAAPL